MVSNTRLSMFTNSSKCAASSSLLLSCSSSRYVLFGVSKAGGLSWYVTAEGVTACPILELGLVHLGAQI